MKTTKNRYIRLRKAVCLALAACTAGFVSCSDEFDAFLEIDPQETISLPATGGSTTVALETNVDDWTFRFEYGEWLLAKIADGGIVITAEPNDNFNSRGATLSVTSASHPEVNKRLGIRQRALSLTLNPDPLPMFPAEGKTAEVAVDANIGSDDWEITGDAGNGWIKAEKVPGGISVTVTANPDMLPRAGTLGISSGKYPTLNTVLPVKQFGTDKTIREVILYETFDWLLVPGADNIWTTSGEQRIDNWIARYGESARGWSYSMVTTSKGNKEPLSFSRNGFVKMCITNYSGDIITPKLEAIKGEQTVEVLFKACGYVENGGSASYAGRKDPIQDGKHIDVPNVMKIALIGPGELSQTEFDIDNYPYSSGTSDHEPGYIWQNDLAASQRKFTITGATSETQVQFISGPQLGYSEEKITYRKALDDILIVIREQ